MRFISPSSHSGLGGELEPTADHSKKAKKKKTKFSPFQSCAEKIMAIHLHDTYSATPGIPKNLSQIFKYSDWNRVPIDVTVSSSKLSMGPCNSWLTITDSKTTRKAKSGMSHLWRRLYWRGCGQSLWGVSVKILRGEPWVTLYWQLRPYPRGVMCVICIGFSWNHHQGS